MLKNVMNRICHKKKINFSNPSLKSFSKINGCLISIGLEHGSLFETTACNIAISRNKKINRKYISFDVFDENRRNVLEEAIRILRDDVKNISELNSSKIDFVVIPGGNIFDLLLQENFDIHNNEILSQLSLVIREFNGLKKPILFTSNSSLLACKVLGKHNLGPGISITYGAEAPEWNNKEYIKYAIDNGNVHKPKKEDEHCVDNENSIITLAGTLKNNSNLNSIFNSIDKGILAIYNLVKLVKI